MPPSFRSVEFSPICDIDFATHKQKWKRSLHGDEVCSKSKPSYKILKPKADDICVHYQRLSGLKVNPVLLSLVAKFNDTYIPLYEKGVLPKPLTHLYKATTLSYPDLLNKFEQVYQGIALAAEQVKAVEVKSRDQSGATIAR